MFKDFDFFDQGIGNWGWARTPGIHDMGSRDPFLLHTCPQDKTWDTVNLDEI